MAGPVITTLLSPNPANGTQTTDGTENSLASGTASGTYVLTLETINMADGDVLEIRGYHKPGASSTKRQTSISRSATPRVTLASSRRRYRPTVTLNLRFSEPPAPTDPTTGRSSI
jgi:hypothetical protein